MRMKWTMMGEDCGEDKERYGYDGIIHCNMEITQLC